MHAGLFGVILSWAVNQGLTKALLASVPPLPFLCVRFAGLVALALALRRRGRGPAWTRRERLLGAAAGLCGFFLNQIGFAYGLAGTTVFSTSLLIAAAPVFALAALGAWRIERVGRRQWAGVGLAFAGIALFVSEGARLGLGRGDLFSLLAGVSFAALNVINKPLLARHSPGEVLGENLLWGGVPLLLVTLPSALQQPWQQVAPVTWAMIAYTIAIPIFVSYRVWNWAISRVGVGRTVVYAYLTPVLAGTLSAVFFGEAFGPAKLVGAAACLGGLALASGRGGREREAVEATGPGGRLAGGPRGGAAPEVAGGGRGRG